MNELMTVGELAKMMGVTVRTIQYYDKENILKPSSMSEGGRRLYSAKDVVKLHQILSFKYLGFSLEEIRDMIMSMDTPDEVCSILEHQREKINEQIHTYNKILESIDMLYDEVKKINSVDFTKYAQIIELIRMGNREYWVWKFFDEELATHSINQFGDKAAMAEEFIGKYKQYVEEALVLKRSKVSPESEAAIACAGKWWDMVMEFTGGDISLFPNLIEFNKNKSAWDNDMAEKQNEIDGFIGLALGSYFEAKGISFAMPETE